MEREKRKKKQSRITKICETFAKGVTYTYWEYQKEKENVERNRRNI